MGRIVVSIHNGLLVESILRMLEESAAFQAYRSVSDDGSSLVNDCKMYRAEVLLMDVSYAAGASLQERLETVRSVRKELPDCKIALLCDEYSAPDLARSVALTKRDGQVDDFFYSSVTGTYLIAALSAL